MLYALIAIVGILTTIFFVIGTHEAAHFWMARILGVKVLRFSIGFGKTLFRWHDKKGTEYVFALVPLGGYVKMLDESEVDEPIPPAELKYAFNRQPLYKKFLIVLAGPLCNILCGFLLYWMIFTIGFISIKPIVGKITPESIAASAGMQGNQEIVRVDHSPTQTWSGILLRLISHFGDKDHVTIETKQLSTQVQHTYRLDLTTWEMNELTPDPLSSIGIVPYEPPIPLVIGEMNEKAPAAQSHLKIGDKIIAVNHQPIQNWIDVITIVQKNPDQTLIFTIERKGKKEEFPVKVGHQRSILLEKTGYLGIGPAIKMPKELLQTIQYSPLTAIPRAAKEVMNFTYFNFVLFGKIITGKLSLQSLGGPITIFETAGEALNYGYIAFLGFLAFLSLSVGVVNFFPIPGLDGGHLLLYTIELIMRRPVPERIQLLLFRLGFLLIIFVLIQALINDILRL